MVYGGEMEPHKKFEYDQENYNENGNYKDLEQKPIWEF